MIRQLDAETLKKFLAALEKSPKTDILIVYAYATWCGYCQRGMPIFEAQAKDLPVTSKVRGRIFKYDSSQPAQREAFLKATGHPIPHFPSIFCFFKVPGKPTGCIAIPANGQYSEKFTKLNRLIQ